MEKSEVHKNTPKKRNELDAVLRLFSAGLKKYQVRNKLNLSKTNLANYLRKLELSGNIQRIGKYEVKVLSSSLNHPRVTVNSINSKLNKRGHAHNFKIIFPQETDLRVKPLIMKYKETHENKIQALSFGSLRFSYKRFTIWINKSTLTVYSNNSYYSDDALHSKFTALKEVDNLVKYLKDKFQIKGIYGIEIFREHYGLIFNEFAKWLLERNEKMEVKDKGNKSILWVDDSKEDDIGLKEFEGINPLEVNNADNLFKSHVRTGWKVTPEFDLLEHEKLMNNQIIIKNEIGSLRKDLNYVAKNQVSHVRLIEKASKVMAKLDRKLSYVSENRELNLDKSQRSIFDYG